MENCTVVLINGPNLNLLGTREPHIYGSTTLKQVIQRVASLLAKENIGTLDFQSNHEGAIIDFIHQQREAAYTIINPGGLTHTSVALLDALTAFGTPYAEVHISNIHARESFRQFSYLSSQADGVIMGLGTYGYELAALAAIENLRRRALII